MIPPEPSKRSFSVARGPQVDCEFTGCDVGEGDHTAENFSASGGSTCGGPAGDVSMNGYATEEEEVKNYPLPREQTPKPGTELPWKT